MQCGWVSWICDAPFGAISESSESRAISDDIARIPEQDWEPENHVCVELVIQTIDVPLSSQLKKTEYFSFTQKKYLSASASRSKT